MKQTFGLGLAFLVVLQLGAQLAAATCGLTYVIHGVYLYGSSPQIWQWNMSGSASGCGSYEKFVLHAPKSSDPSRQWRQVGHTLSVGPTNNPPIYIPPDMAGWLQIEADGTAQANVNWTAHPFWLSDVSCCADIRSMPDCTDPDYCHYTPYCLWDSLGGFASNGGVNPLPALVGDPATMVYYMNVSWDNTWDTDDEIDDLLPDMCYFDNVNVANYGLAVLGVMPGPEEKDGNKEKEIAIDEEELEAVEKAVDLARLKKQHIRAEQK